MIIKVLSVYFSLLACIRATSETERNQLDAGVLSTVPQPVVDKTLKFNENHEFTILQITDLHYGNDEVENMRSTKAQEAVIEAIKPDLVVVTGDAVSGYDWDKKTKGYFRSKWEEFTAPYSKYKVRYAFVFGNHEIEADLTPKEIGELDKTHPYSMFHGSAQPDREGYSNYVLKVNSAFPDSGAQPSALLWMFDTRKEGCDGEKETYGCIDKAQLEWYKKESQKFVQGDGATKIQGLAFFHIPIPEFMFVWNTHFTYGSKNETVGCPTTDSGAFSVFKETKNIQGIFVGHDHTNDYGGMYKGIELVYGRKSGYGSYGPNAQKGARVIKLKEELGPGGKDPKISFTSYIVEEDKTVHDQGTPQWRGNTQYQTVCSARVLQIIIGLSINLFLTYYK